MPVGFNSPARNLFLLGSSGAQVVSNFFESISKASTTDGVFIPDEIRYIESNKKYALAGSAADSNSKGFGWLERQDYNLETGTLTTDYSKRIESTQAGVNTTLRAMELDSNNNLIVVGFSGAAPWIAKYSNDGVLDWQSTTNSGNVRYLGVTSDSNGNYYACGRTSLTAPDTQAFVEKFDSNGNPGWGKSAFMLGRDVVLEKISANTRGEVVAVGYLEDDSADKGYIIKIDTNTGEVLWDRTLERNISGFGLGNPSTGSTDSITPAHVRCTACYIDSQDQIYVVGTIDGNPPNDNGVGEFLIKYTAEGNMVWQRENNTRDYVNLDGAPNMVPFDVKSDGETEQTVVLSVEDFGAFALNNSDIFISKYSKSGDLVFRRRISKGGDNLGAACLDADPSFYYIMFRDQQRDGLAGEPDRYTFGKVSTSGNGFGNFQYDDGEDIIDYTIVSNAENKIGRLSDGSVRNDTSDLMTYPFTANKIVFDDLATHVSNKKRQMDGPDSFEYSGSPAIRPADFQELNLLGESIVVGPELITNGDFSNGTTGWSNNPTEILTVSGGGVATVDRNGGSSQGQCYQTILTEVGRSYTVSVLVNALSNGFQVYANNGATAMSQGAVNSTGTHYWTFTATTPSTRLDFSAVQNVNGTASFDNISAKEYTWLDRSGKGNTGRVQGGTTSSGNGYWTFDGVDDKIVIDSLSNFAPSEVTFEAWFKKPTGSGYKGLVDKGRDNYGAYTINVDETGSKATFTAKISGVNGSVVCATQYGSNVWTHVVGTYDGTDLKIYLNGSLDGTTNIPGVLGSNTVPVTIGSTNDGLEYGGEIGEVRIYPRALTAAQVFQNYNATKSKYRYEAPDTAPKISSDAIVYGNLLLNYDFGNRATYDPVTNKFSNSSDITKSSWSNLNSSTEITLNAAIAPDGSLTAAKINANSLYEGIVNDGDFTISAWVKTVDGTSKTFGQQVYLLNTGGDVLSTTHTATGEWQRFTFSGVATSAYGNPSGQAHRYSPFTGSNELYVWAPQVEFQSSAGRYVPTYGIPINLSYGFNSLVSTETNGTFNDEPKNQFIDGTVKCNGSFEYITFPSVTVSDGSSSTVSWTAELWIKPDAYTGSSDIADLLSDGTYKIELEQGGSDAGKIRYRYSTTNASNFSNLALTAGQWNHLVVTFSPFPLATSVSVKAWMNNNFTINTGHTEPLQQIVNRSGNGFLGRIAELRIYDRDLTEAEISKNYNATRGKYGV